MENLSLSLHSFPDQHLVLEFVLSGNVDARSLIQLERGFRAQLMASKFRWIVEIGGLDYISGACLESFVSSVAELRRSGGDHFLLRVPPNTQNIFAALGFNLLFRIRDDEKMDFESLAASTPLEDEGSLISSRYQG
jgi:anti-anti-sigma factor